MNVLKEIESRELKEKKFDFKVGDKISVNFKILDTTIRKKNYDFTGFIIAIKNNGINRTCTLFKKSFGEDVEKTFFINSPLINSFTLIKESKYKKSKLYNMKDKLSK